MTDRFTTKELADLRLPGLPTTPQGWDKLVKVRGWEYSEGRGRGRGGVRREFLPPEDVMNLIQQVRLLNSFDTYRAQISAGEPLATVKANFVNDYNERTATVNAVDGIEVLTLEQLDDAIRDSSRAVIYHATGSGKTNVLAPLVQEALTKEKAVLLVADRQNVLDSRRELLEAVLRVGEHKILHNQVTKHVIEFGLEGAPFWLEAARDFPDLELRLRNMVATFKFLAAANEPPSSGSDTDKPTPGGESYSW